MRRYLTICAAAIVTVAASAWAHFPFIVPNRDGKTARLVMSETLSPDLDVGIDIVAGAKLWLRQGDGKETPLAFTKAGDHMAIEIPGEGTRVVRGIADLGVMSRGKTHLLVYYPKTILGDAFAPSTVVGAAAPVELIPVRAAGGFKLRLMVDGKAAPEQDVKVLTPDGEQSDWKTDAEGLTTVLTQTGRYGAWARRWMDQAGERDGKKYEQLRQYATLVFDAEVSPGAVEQPKSAWAPMPQPAASFGAVASDGWLYVYGGHITDRHEYSTASVSGEFQRLNLKDPSKWEKLPGGVKVQGMNLAAHAGKVYRVGGMEPRNAPEEENDTHSIASAAEFDPGTMKWRELAALPRARSSHDVLVVDGSLMVVGGWCMKGKDEETQWLDTMEVLDLGAAEKGWRSVPQPFTRRALIAAAADGRVFVIGGFDADDRAQLDVDIYEVKSGSWTKGPPIPGKKRNGFGPAACAHEGSVYLSVSTGEMFRLKPGGAAWELVATTTPRIVHRLIPLKDQILVVGGAAEEKMVGLIEGVKVDQ